MAVGQVSFHSDKRVGYGASIVEKYTEIDTKRLLSRSREVILFAFPLIKIALNIFWIVHVAERENAVVNRLNKTKVERLVDHEQEKIDRIKRETAIRRTTAAEKVYVSSVPL